MRVFSLAERQIFILLIISFIFLLNHTFFAQENNLELQSLSEGADVIAIGRVIQQKSDWNEGKTRIYTNVTIQVDEYLKGGNASEIVVRHPGGEVGEIGELYSHMPKFNDNEETLLFLEREKQGVNFKVLNGERGKITLIKNKETGESLTPSNEKISIFKNQIKKYIGGQQ